eukprot:15352238-Ditylum_brightwellii.AAC.1
MGIPEEWLQFVYTIAHVIKGQDIQDGKAAYSTMHKGIVKNNGQGVNLNSDQIGRHMSKGDEDNDDNNKIVADQSIRKTF